MTDDGPSPQGRGRLVSRASMLSNERGERIGTLAEGWSERMGEPDAWAGSHLGFPLYARRSDFGNWCGYIGLPDGHPWAGVTSSEIDTAVTVHGGVTYLQDGLPSAASGDASAWYVGFDCAHAGDFLPGLVQAEPGVDPLATATLLHVEGNSIFGGTYRTLEYVQAELRRLAEQARAAQG